MRQTLLLLSLSILVLTSCQKSETIDGNISARPGGGNGGGGSSINLTQGLVAFYPFNGNANDASGNGNNGTVYGASLTTDRFNRKNRAYSFNGLSNYISIPDNSNLRLQNTDFTFNAWILPNDYSGNHIFYKGQSSGNDFPKYIFRWYDGQYAFHINGPGLSTGIWYYSNNTPIQTWQMGTIVKNGSIISFYINGLLVNQISFDSAIPNTEGFEARIGGPEPNGGGYWNGLLDDIRIYNRALTQAEITYLARN